MKLPASGLVPEPRPRPRAARDRASPSSDSAPAVRQRHPGQCPFSSGTTSCRPAAAAATGRRQLPRVRRAGRRTWVDLWRDLAALSDWVTQEEGLRSIETRAPGLQALKPTVWRVSLALLRPFLGELVTLDPGEALLLGDAEAIGDPAAVPSRAVWSA